jgi:hypothetical protein
MAGISKTLARAFFLLPGGAKIHLPWLFLKEKPPEPLLARLRLQEKCSRIPASSFYCCSQCPAR